MKPVLPSHVIIDNLPAGVPWYQLWIPIIVAIISIFISIYSIYYTRKTFTLNARPYIWAANYGVVQNNLLVQIPQVMIFYCKEHPAKVSFKYSIILHDEVLFTHSVLNSIQFPDGSQWTFSVGQNDWNTIINRPAIEQSSLNRLIEFEYSDLDQQNKYKSSIRQIFKPLENQWETISSDAN